MQNCSLCPQLKRCWVDPPSDEFKAINILVCRLKLGIELDRTVKALLQLLQPKIQKTKRWIDNAIRPHVVDSTTLQAEIECVVIERLMFKYVLGERASPIQYVFEHRNGIQDWALRYANELRRYYKTNFVFGLVSDADDEDQSHENEFETQIRSLNSASTRGVVHDLPLGFDSDEAAAEGSGADEAPSVTTALNLLKDGVTLNLQEYRILAFCLRNANTNTPKVTSRSAARGLHVYLSKIMKLHRTRVTRLYANATRRLIESAGRADNHFMAKGIVVPPELAKRRTNWANGKASRTALPPDVAEHLFEEVEAGGKISDICAAYGISDSHYYRLRAKYRKQ